MENIKFPETIELAELTKKYRPFLLEIRKRLLLTAILFVIATITGFAFYEKLIKFLIIILNLQGVNIVFTSPFQFISLAISCGLAIGLIVAFPLLLYQILSFLKPALKGREFNMMLASLPFLVIFFVMGFSFGVFIMQWQIQLSVTKSLELGIGNVLDITRLLSTVIMVSMIMGLAFEFPIILLLLLRIRLIKRSQLSKQRLWIYLGALIFVILLPIDSILGDFLLTLPLIFLFEVTLLLDRILGKRKIKEK